MCIRDRASTIAKIINDAEGNGEQLAIALDAKNVVVAIPQNERSRPTDFIGRIQQLPAVSYTHLRAHETVLDLVCRLLLEKKK